MLDLGLIPRKSMNNENTGECMKLIGCKVVLGAMILLSLTGCQAVESSRTIAPKQVESVRFVPLEQRKKVLVTQFKNASDYQRGVFSSNEDRLGNQARDILSSHLQITNAFKLVNRQESKELAAEAAVAGTRQALTGAHYAIAGSVLEFGRKVTGDKQFFGVLGRGKNQIAYSKVALQVTDIKTSEVIMSVQGAGEYQLSNREVVGFGSTAGYDATLNGKVLNLAIVEAVQKLVEQLYASEFTR